MKFLFRILNGCEVRTFLATDFQEVKRLTIPQKVCEENYLRFLIPGSWIKRRTHLPKKLKFKRNLEQKQLSKMKNNGKAEYFEKPPLFSTERF